MLRGKQRAAKAKHLCACVFVCERGEERKRKRGGRWQQARPAKGEREEGKEGGNECMSV